MFSVVRAIDREIKKAISEDMDDALRDITERVKAIARSGEEIQKAITQLVEHFNKEKKTNEERFESLSERLNQLEARSGASEMSSGTKVVPAKRTPTTGGGRLINVQLE